MNIILILLALAERSGMINILLASAIRQSTPLLLAALAHIGDSPITRLGASLSGSHLGLLFILPQESAMMRAQRST